MKKIIILKHGGGELANQLWNYMSIYAYGLESGAIVENPSFFEYHRQFRFLRKESILTHFLSFWFKNSEGRRSNNRNRFWRRLYRMYAAYVTFVHRGAILSSENRTGTVTYLPPTPSKNPLDQHSKVYCLGWLFRNPLGLKKFRKELVQAFRPTETVEEKVGSILTLLRRHKTVVGLHLRQADYKEFKGGVFAISQERAREIASEYLQEKGLRVDETVFLITSDGPIDETVFEGLNIFVSRNNAVVDLFLLSGTDAIIGSDSSFGSFAAWYGDIPHIIMTKESLDWSYYEGKDSYFENKYSQMVRH